MLNLDGDTIWEDGKIADVFNKQFISVFVDDNGTLPAMNAVDSTDFNNINDNICFTAANICKILRRLKIGSSPGLDGIPSVVLKYLSDSISSPLQVIFQQSFDSGVLPQEWLKAKIRPIFKNNGSRTNAATYRPISLTSICCKVMERILKGFLLDHLAENSIITPSQHGFLATKSTETQLLECVNDWTGSLNRQENVDVFYMDISKAFDVVSHPKLLHKLEKYKISGKFHGWISAFLQNRSQCVIVNETLSEEQKVRSGVPQGSVLGPLLFLLYINDLPNVVNESTVKIFADDTKLYLSRKKNSSFDALQGDIERLLVWTAENQLGVAFHKSNVLHLGLCNPQTEYIFETVPIPSPQVVKDLGVYITNDMKFNVHIDRMVAKALRMSGLVFKSFMCRDHVFLTKMFTVFVRPVLEYCTTVWSPQGLENIKKIERVQRRFTKRYPGLSDVPYLERLEALNLERLELRRIRFDIIMTFNIVKAVNGLKFADFFEYASIGRVTRSITKNYLLLDLPKKGINVYSHSFAQRSVKFWNFLSDNEVFASNVDVSKSRLNQVNLSSMSFVNDFL